MRKAFVFILSVLLASQSFATPFLSSTSGTIGTGNALVINGSGFDTKPRSKPLIWWDPSDITIQPDATLSFMTSWSATQATTIGTTNTRYGAHVITTNGSATWPDMASGTAQWHFTQQILMPATQSYGGKFRCNVWRRSTMPVATITGRNIKPWRYWVNGVASPQYPNLNISNDVWFVAGNDPRWYVESGNTTTDPIVNGTNRIYEGAYTNLYDGSWHFDDVLIKRNSSAGATDGQMFHYMDNATMGSSSHFQTDYADFPGLLQYIIYQTDLTGSSNPGGDMYHDSLYLDDSWNMVMVGNASTFAACTHLEVQPYTSWTSGTINIVQKLGTLTGNKYLYVADNSNVVNPNGLLLGSSSLSNPQITLVYPANGKASGNTGVTISGLGFVSTPQVKFGNNFATGVVFFAANQVACVTPAGTAGTTVDVTLINPDSAQAVMTNGFSYDPAQITINPVTEVFPWK